MKEKEKALNIRIKETILKEFDNKLALIYEKENHRKQSHIIKKLITEFNGADTEIIKDLIDKDELIINTGTNKTIAEKQEAIRTLTDTLKEADKKIKQLENTITEKNETIAEKENIIKQQTKEYTTLKQQQDAIINNSLKDKDELIKELRTDKRKLERRNKQQNKDYSSMKKEKDAYNNAVLLLQQKNNKLTNTIIEYKKLSFFERLFKYPDANIDAIIDADIIALADEPENKQ